MPATPSLSAIRPTKRQSQPNVPPFPCESPDNAGVKPTHPSKTLPR